MTYETALRLTDREAWSHLTEEGKVEVLQAIEDQAASESGRLARPVVSEALYVGNDGVELGCYRHDQQTIYVNAYQLGEGSLYGDNPDKLAEVVLHEGRHAFQHDVAEGKVPYDEEAADAWAKNLEPGGYVSFHENPRAYYEQPVEADARSFAASRLAQLQQERTALAERDAAKEAQAAGQDAQGQGSEKNAPSQGPGESGGLGGTAGPSESNGLSDGGQGGAGQTGGDGHDDAREAFEAAGESVPGVAQHHSHGLRMM